MTLNIKSKFFQKFFLHQINFKKSIHTKVKRDILAILLFENKGIPLIHYFAKGKNARASPSLTKFIRTDNESVFTSRLFKTCLRLMGIRHQPIDLAQPWQNGRIERLFGTLKERLNGWEVDSFTDLKKSLVQFQFWYNHVRPHQNLNGKTPGEVWYGKDIFSNGFKQQYWFEAWDGLLTGFYLQM